jgi:hypothetical protein
VEPLQGEGWPTGEEDLSDHQLEGFLAKARILSQESRVKEGLQLQILELEQKDMKLRALFGDADESAAAAAADGRKARRRFQNQVAAYRLDRLFGLKMVPVTAFRTVDGRKGGVQIWIQSALDATEIREYGAAKQFGDLGPELARARAFSGLIGLEKRINFGKLILPTIPPRVMLSDNGASFADDPDIRDFLEEGCGPVGDAFLHSLGTLEKGKMKKELGDLLTAAQIEAVLSRRDGILELCAEPNPDWSWEKIVAKSIAAD